MPYADSYFTCGKKKIVVLETIAKAVEISQMEDSDRLIYPSTGLRKFANPSECHSEVVRLEVWNNCLIYATQY